MARDKTPPGIEHDPFLDPTQRQVSPLETIIRNICREEIAQHLEMAKALQKFAGVLTPPKPCEECVKLKAQSVRFQHCLGLAKIALKKIAQLDPVAAAQRAQAQMPAEHDIAKLSLREIERNEDAE